MKIRGEPYRSLWWDDAAQGVRVIDQLQLPWTLDIALLTRRSEVEHAIRSMRVRGAPLIGLVGAYGLVLAMRHDPSDAHLAQAAADLLATRPTAVNLRFTLQTLLTQLQPLPPAQRYTQGLRIAADLVEQDVALCHAIGQHGLALIDAAWQRKGRQGAVQVLTHCNAGWLATVDWGTALAPIYAAHDRGIPLHVWVDETRPRNQGALLTALELGWHGVPHTVIVDNAGGHLMQHGQVDLCLVGADRVSRQGDTANKIGTYLKALAAHDNQVPFYVALPSPTIDWQWTEGVHHIPIEERAQDEVLQWRGQATAAPGSTAANPAFDVTPARLVTAFITERGVLPPARLSALEAA